MYKVYAQNLSTAGIAKLG